MKEECVHQRETLEHGLYALILAELEVTTMFFSPDIPPEERERIQATETSPPLASTDFAFAAGLLNTFRDHEAREVNMEAEAHQLLSMARDRDAKLPEATRTARREFFRRALDQLTQCECRG